MTRERVQAVRAAQEPPVSESDVRAVFQALLSGLRPLTFRTTRNP